MSTTTRALRDLRRPERHAPELRIVQEATKQRRDRLARLATALAGLVVCFGLFGVIGMQVMLAQGQSDVQRLQEQVNQEQTLQRQLQLEAAELEAPSRVVGAARDRLGMVTPTTVVTLAPATLDNPPETTIPPATSPTTAPSTTVPQP